VTAIAAKPAKRKPRVPKTRSYRLDLGCGQAKQEGFTGVDIAGDADVIHDLFSFPWPFPDSSVEEIHASHFVEHIPHYRPDWDRDGWWMFFNECYRICKPDAKLTFVHPYVKCDRAFWDPTHTRYIHETTWYYGDRQWREQQRLDHYPADCDFEVTLIQGTGVDQDVAARHHEFQAVARHRYWNVIPDLIVELKARK
jgi:predicted SAM-dependent methyltransferase